VDRPGHEPPVTKDEIRRSAWQRAPGEREPAPEPGEVVLLRAADWEPAVSAVVLGVQDMATPGDFWDGPGGEPDICVWDEDGALRPDPWPWVTLQPEDGPQRHAREARVRGAAGWLRPGSARDTTGRR
jgi:hypothetical protein